MNTTVNNYNVNSSLKEMKEAFVSGHSGTNNVFEVLLLCIPPTVGILLTGQIRDLLLSTNILGNRMTLKRGFIFLIECIFYLWPMLYSNSEYFYDVHFRRFLKIDIPNGVVLLAIELILFFILKSEFVKKWLQPNAKLYSKPEPETANSSALVTNYRATVMFMTIIAILAVDFNVFPRRLAKTETVGFGFMDLGAASYVIAGGIVSPFARRTSTKTVFNIKFGAYRSIPLILIGFLRLVTVKGVDYQEHVTEYGVHWNFFFTLAVLNVLSPLFRKILTAISSFSVKSMSSNIMARKRDALMWKRVSICFIVLAVYQFVLLGRFGLQDYIENAPRTCELADELSPSSYYDSFTRMTCNLFAANREGICGTLGYLALYFISEEFGYYCVWEKRFQKRVLVKNIRLAEQVRTSAICLLIWLCLLITSWIMGLPVSRRTTNLSFILWALAQNFTVLHWLSLTSSGHRASLLCKGMNRNGLFLFMLANLITGVVNLSINTLEVSNYSAISILAVYALFIAVTAVMLDNTLNVTIKLV